MHIQFLGPAHPYRGGLAAILHTMADHYQKQGHRVAIKTFRVQYPTWLFPGKSQYAEGPAPEGLSIERCIHTANPLNWLRLGWRLRRERPDLVILKYWTTFMAPFFGTIARLARRNGHTKFICQIDNVEPHEPHFFDRWF
ncbi:MAG: glycosyltransferase, partial [Alistipes sp.]|nr:glycosyltransferase [Alistipes sp.]